MNEKTIVSEISALIDKINALWTSTGKEQNSISRIEKDLLMSDLRLLYDKMFHLAVAEEVIPEKKPVMHDQEPPSVQFSFAESDPEKNPEPVTGKFTAKYAVHNPDQPDADFQQFSSEKSFTTSTGNQQELSIGQQNQKTKPSVKSTVEMFPATKTVADIYQNHPDKSVAAKMQSNRISDIRSAIGVNEKILFIREIFHNDADKYNEAIDYLNQTENFYEALQFIDQLKAGKINDDNKAAFARLLDFSKRKFY